MDPGMTGLTPSEEEGGVEMGGGSFGGRAHPPPTLLPLPQAEDVCATNHGCVGWLASLEEVLLSSSPFKDRREGPDCVLSRGEGKWNHF